MIGPSDRLTAGAVRESPHVLLVGDVMLDRYLIGAVERISPEAPVPVLHVQRSFNRPGGAGNVAVNMSAMGGRPTLRAAVGADAAGRLLAAALEADGVAGTGLVPSASTPTTVKTRLLAGHNQIARFDEESPLIDAAARGRIVELVREHLPQADVAVISDYAKGVCDGAVCRGVIEAARDRGIPVIVDPKGHDFSRYAGASVLTPNRAETTAVVGFPIRGPDDAVRAGQILRRDHDIDAVVVTLAVDPALCGECFRVAAPSATRRTLQAGGVLGAHYALAEIEQERRGGYAFYGDWPASLLEKDYPRWRAKLAAAR